MELNRLGRMLQGPVQVQDVCQRLLWPTVLSHLGSDLNKYVHYSYVCRLAAGSGSSDQDACLLRIARCEGVA